MREWKYKVNIKKWLDPAKDLSTVKGAVAKELRRVKPFRDDEEGSLLVLELEQAVDVQDFDEVLEQIYDFADTNRVWLGLA